MDNTNVLQKIDNVEKKIDILIQVFQSFTKSIHEQNEELTQLIELFKKISEEQNQ